VAGRLIIVWLAVASAGCSGNSGTFRSASSTSTSSPSSTTLPTAATASDLTFCVSETNRYRALVGKTPLLQSAALEAYAAAGAEADSITRMAHSHFDNTNGGGLALAENELLTTGLALFGSVQEAMRQTIASFYAEGASGADYQNLEGPYTQVGCGVFIANAAITFVQDFR
jgi:hypothetical protein